MDSFGLAILGIVFLVFFFPITILILYYLYILSDRKLLSLRQARPLATSLFDLRPGQNPASLVAKFFESDFLNDAPTQLQANYHIFDSHGYSLNNSRSTFALLASGVSLEEFIVRVDLSSLPAPASGASGLCGEFFLVCKVFQGLPSPYFKIECKWNSKWYADPQSQRAEEEKVLNYLMSELNYTLRTQKLKKYSPAKSAASALGSHSPKGIAPPVASGGGRVEILPPVSAPRRWPSPHEFSEAIQNPQFSFQDQELSCASVEFNEIGIPKVASGMFASVYELNTGLKKYAVRCFNQDPGDQDERYKKISEFILSDDLPQTVGFNYLEKGVKIGGNWYPILKMDWVEGKTLESYIGAILHDRPALEELRRSFHELMQKLADSGIAHGDLQHGNIMVSNQRIYLVDYDGFYVPALEGKGSKELGHANYQHPARSSRHYGSYLDNFSACLIDCSLICLIEDPQLWHLYQGGDECLLFRRQDLCDPDNSQLFQSLLKHESFKIRSAMERLIRYLKLEPEQVPPLAESLNINELGLGVLPGQAANS